MNALVPINAAPPMTISDVERVALAIAKGGLFGSNDPNAVLTLCLLAQAEGQHPAVVFRDYHIIQGKPAKKAEAMLRDFINAGGKVEWHKLDDTAADATFSHPCGSARIDWTMERAKKAGLTTAMWNKYPRQMLRSRVISEGIRTVYPGATSGLYESGEVADITGTEAPIDLTPQDNPTADEPTPKARVVLDGPYKSPTALAAAIKAFAESLRVYDDDLAGFSAWMETPEVVELEKQAMKDAPELWETGEGYPDEFVPVVERIHQKKRQLELADIHEINQFRTPVDAG